MLLNSFTKYQDEFGEIEADVLREAQNIRHYGKNLTLKIFNDEQIGQVLLMRAAAKVSAKIKKKDSTVKYLRGYLFTTFRRLVFAEARKQRLHQKLEEKYFESLEQLFQNTGISEEERIYRQILIKEIEAKMDDWTKKVMRYRALGYGFNELVSPLGMAENVIRATYSRNLKRLAKSFDEK